MYNYRVGTGRQRIANSIFGEKKISLIIREIHIAVIHIQVLNGNAQKTPGMSQMKK